MIDEHETRLRDDALAPELRAYFRETTATPRPAQRNPRRHRLRLGVPATVGLSAALAIAVFGSSYALLHSRANLNSSTGPTVTTPAINHSQPNATPQLIIAKGGTQAGSATEILALPLTGSPPHVIATYPGMLRQQPVNASFVAATHRYVITSDRQSTIMISDLQTGKTNSMDLGRVTNGVLDPSQTRLAIRVFHGLGPVELDIIDLSAGTITLLQQMPPTAAMSPYRWSSDGIHALQENITGMGSPTVTCGACAYVLDPGSGKVLSSISGDDYGTYSHDGRVMAVTQFNSAGVPDAIAESVAGGPLHRVYTASPGNTTEVLAVSDDGSLIVDNSPSHTGPGLVPTIVLVANGVSETIDNGGTFLGGAAQALPGHGFVLQVKTATGTELRTVSGTSPTNVTPLPTDAGQVIGITW